MTDTQVLRITDDVTLPPLRNPVVTLGTFDGVHLGHLAILNAIVSEARTRNGHSVVVTFDPHPRQVLNPAIAPDLLTTTEKRVALISAAGVDVICLIEFTRDFSNMDPALFVEEFLVGRLGVQHMVVGYDTRFGMHRRGDHTLLEEMGQKHGFTVTEVGPLQVTSQTASSSLIRECLQLGDLELAAQLLGRQYSILGEIVRGDGLGRKLGYPTANIRAYQEAIPPNGVYAVFVKLPNEQALFGGTMNIGVRPTVGDSLKRTVEVHIHAFDAIIYGTEVEVFFVKKLRDEQRFDGLDALQAQIERDIAHSVATLLAESD